MNFTIDLENRRVVVDATTLQNKSNPIIINEFDKLTKNFLPNTQDKYECELVLLEVENENGELETKAFTRRIGYEGWIMEFNFEDYSK